MFESKKYSEFSHLSDEHLNTLLECFSACSACAKMCMEEKRSETAILCSECADICALTIKFRSADSIFTRQICNLCAEICSRCAASCEKQDTSHCQQCSEICQECAASCKR